MRWTEWWHVGAASAVVVLLGAACGNGGSADSKTASPTPAPSEATSPVGTSAPETTAAVPSFDDMLAKVRSALLQPGKTTHVRMDVHTEAATGADTQDMTVDAWVDPTLALVRVLHGEATATGSEVTFLDSASAVNPEDPAVVELLRLLATQPEGALPVIPPGAVTMHADVLDGRAVIVSEFLFPPVDEAEAQRVSLAYDTDGLPVNEVRRPDGGDGKWTKTVTYEIDFVDRGTLPDDFWQGHDIAEPLPATELPATEPAPGLASYSFATAGEAAPKVAELAQQGLTVTWLGPEYGGARFTGVSIDYSGSPPGAAPLVDMAYFPVSSDTGTSLLIEQTAAVNWPIMQSIYPDVASIETSGEPVASLGERAFLARGAAWEMPGFGALVVFRNGTVVLIQGPGVAATVAETDAQLIAAAQALQPFPMPTSS